MTKGRLLPNGKDMFRGRPGAELPALDFSKTEATLREKYGVGVREVDVLSYVMYPKVFDEWVTFTNQYGDVSVLPTPYFVHGMSVGEEIAFEIEKGKTLYVRLKSVGKTDETGYRDCMFELNGENRVVRIPDAAAGTKVKTRMRASKTDITHVAAPMPGVVVDVRASIGKTVHAGDPIAVLSAMKMETIVGAHRSGVIKSVAVSAGDTLEAGDLVATIE